MKNFWLAGVLLVPAVGFAFTANGDEKCTGQAKQADRSLHLWVLLNLVLWHDHWIAGDF